MSFFDIIDRRQPKPEEPKPDPQAVQMPRLSLDELEKLPADYDPRNPVTPTRKKPGRPPKVKP